MSSFHAGGDTNAAAKYDRDYNIGKPKKEAPVAKKQQWSLWRFLTGNSMAEIARAKTPYKIAKEEEKTERIETRTGATTENLKTVEQGVSDVGQNTNDLVLGVVNSPNAPAIAKMIAGAAGGNPAAMLGSLQSMGAGAAPSSTSGTGTFHAEKAPKPKKDNNGLLLLGGGLLLLAVASNNGSKK